MDHLLLFDENNEVFKIALRQGALNIIPAFYEKQSGWLPYWYRSNFVEMMRDAHLTFLMVLGGKLLLLTLQEWKDS